MLPHMIGRRGPGVAVVVGGGSGSTDGGFVSDPIVTTTASGNTTVKGQVKPGSFGKFVYPLATITAGRQYTFRYTPQFQQLAQQGKLAMVGFGLKNNNDFHIVGLRGDGSTGVDKYKVNGTPPNGWNKDTGHTTSDGGAAAAGTQAGPNYIRLIVLADGTTYTFQTSSNGTAWNTEYTGAAPTPFANVSSVTTFGIALWFNNADAGPFSIVIDQFADAVAPVTDPNFASVKLLLGFDGADAATATSDESGAAHGAATFNGNAQLDTAQFKFGTSSLLFDGTGDYVTFADSTDWKLSAANSDQFTIEFWMRPHAVGSTFRYPLGQTPGGGNIGWYLEFSNGRLSFNFSTTGSNIVTVSNGTGPQMSVDTWYAIAVDKDATGKIRMYLDGALFASSTPADSSIFDSTGALEIGRSWATAIYDGWIDELRITKGVARYASDSGYTVPTAAFPRA